MAWVVLFIAGLLEIGWAVGLKYTQGFTKLWPSVGTVAAMAASFLLLAWALKTIPVGTGYAVAARHRGVDRRLVHEDEPALAQAAGAAAEPPALIVVALRRPHAFFYGAGRAA